MQTKSFNYSKLTWIPSSKISSQERQIESWEIEGSFPHVKEMFKHFGSSTLEIK